MAVCEYSAHDVTVSRREARRGEARPDVGACCSRGGGGRARGAAAYGWSRTWRPACASDLHFRCAIRLMMALQGGGVYLVSSSSATITSSTISGNSAVSTVVIVLCNCVPETKWLTRLAMGPGWCGWLLVFCLSCFVLAACCLDEMRARWQGVSILRMM